MPKMGHESFSPRVQRSLNEKDSNVLEKGFRVEFPHEVEAEAEKIKSEYKKHFEKDPCMAAN